MMDRGQALGLVKERIPSANLVNHCVATEVIMEALARHFELPEQDVERWALAGLLHDLDYAETGEAFERHGVVTAEPPSGEPDEELLRRKLQAMQLPQTNLAAIVARFRGALEKPGIRAILSRSAYAGGHRPEVWRERPFAIRHEEAILRGTFDRLVVLFDGEKAVGADILDFKSDSLDAGDPAGVVVAGRRLCLHRLP